MDRGGPNSNQNLVFGRLRLVDFSEVQDLGRRPVTLLDDGMHVHHPSTVARSVSLMTSSDFGSLLDAEQHLAATLLR
jgi:hypothetical protein